MEALFPWRSLRQSLKKMAQEASLDKIHSNMLPKQSLILVLILTKII